MSDVRKRSRSVIEADAPIPGWASPRHSVAGASCLLVLGAIACSEPTDRERYRAILGGREAASGSAFDACGAIAAPGLRGDCRLAVIQRLEGEDLSGWCVGFEPGMWQEECWFLEAERRASAGQVAPAARACEQAGAFRADCAQHLWQGRVHGLIFGRGPGAFAEVLPAARSLHRRWSGPLAWDDGFEDRFWSRFYQNGFEGAGPRVMLGACDALPAVDAERCVAAGLELFARELGPGLARGGLDPCGSVRPTLAEVLQFVPADPDTRLQVVLDAAREDCPG